MRSRAIGWWKGRTRRERALLLTAAAIALVVFAWLLVVRPLNDSLSNAKARHNQAVAMLADVRADVDALARAGRPSGAGPAGPVEAIVSAAATEAGFPIARTDRPSATEATLALDAVRPRAFFAWLARMEADRGVRVSRLSVSANADRTLAAQVTFQARGG